jgi:ribonuclease VapC
LIGRVACVVDSSAVLALLNREPGEELVKPLIDRSAISSVNWTEVVQKSLERSIDVGAMAMGLGSVGLSIEPFDAGDAEMTARLWRPTRSAGLSLADRACLALALRLEAPVLTTDRAWAGLDHGVDVQVIR